MVHSRGSRQDTFTQSGLIQNAPVQHQGGQEPDRRDIERGVPGRAGGGRPGLPPETPDLLGIAFLDGDLRTVGAGWIHGGPGSYGVEGTP